MADIPRIITVTLYTSHNTGGEDATNYMVPEYRGQLQAESGLLGYTAGSLDFTILDKGTALTQRYWSTRILTSVAFTLGTGARCNWPVISITETTQDSVVVPLFWGYIERGAVRWEGDAITGFTAVTQLSAFESIDFASHATGTSYQNCNSSAGHRDPSNAKLWIVDTWSSGAGDYVSAGILPGDSLRIGATAYGVAEVQGVDRVLVGATITTIGSAASYVTRGTLTTYSGHAAPLMRRALRVGGNASPNLDQLTPDPADVLMQDYKLGTTQADMDWNHIKRVWQSSAGTNPVDANRMSDFVPFVQFSVQLGFVCVDGKLYRADIANSEPTVASRNGIALTQITTATESAGAAVASGYRLFPYYLADGTACLAVVQAELKQLYNRQVDNWMAPYAAAGSTVAGTAVNALTTLGTISSPAGVALGAGVGVLAVALSQVGNRVTARETGSYVWAVKSIDVLSIGDGTNDPATGVGAAFNKTVPVGFYGNVTQDQFNYTLADSVCTCRPATTQASRIFAGRYQQAAGTTRLLAAFWSGTSWLAGIIRPPQAGIPGQLVGGMAARTDGTNILVAATTANAAYFYSVQSQNTWMVEKLVNIVPFGRFVGAINGAADSTHVLFASSTSNTYWNVSCPDDVVSATQTTIAGTLPTGFKVVCTSPFPLVRSEPDDHGLACVYRKRDSYGNEYGYVGWLQVVNDTLSLVEDICTKAIPNGNASDLRPPMLWKDVGGGRDIIRAIVPATTIDGALLANDFYETALWAVPFQHHNFTSTPLTLRSYIESTARAFNCYLKLMVLDKPATTLDRKVFSRFGYTPADAGGTITASLSVSDQPKLAVDGTEYYLGFESNVMGERIRAGSVTVGTARHVYHFNGPFIVPIWARVMGAWVVGAYPATSVGYPVGRRVIRASLYRLVAGDGSEVSPSVSMLYGKAALTAFSAGSITVIFTGLGFDKTTNLFDATMLEYSTSDVTSTDAAEDVTPVELEIVAEEEITPPSGSGLLGPKQLVSWDCRAFPTNTWESNEKDGPCYYSFTVYYPHGLRLSGYRYQLVVDGLREHNVTTFEHWRDGGDYPLEAVPNTRAWCLHEGLAAGMHRVGLQDVDEVDLSPGLYRIVVGIDRQDAGDPAVIAPPIVWQDSITPTMRGLAIRPLDTGGLPMVGYITAWDVDTDFEVQRVPLVYAEGDA